MKASSILLPLIMGTLVLQGCTPLTPQDPQQSVTPPPPQGAVQLIRAAGGTLVSDTQRGTLLLVRYLSANGTSLSADQPLTVQGPQGWNGGVALELKLPQGRTQQGFALPDVTPVSGRYTLKAGASTLELTLDAAQQSALVSPAEIGIQNATVDGLELSWRTPKTAQTHFAGLLNGEQRVFSPLNVYPYARLTGPLALEKPLRLVEVALEQDLTGTATPWPAQVNGWMATQTLSRASFADPSYGNRGDAHWPSADLWGYSRQLVALPDGGVLALSSLSKHNESPFYPMVRFRADGQPETGFGDQGMLRSSVTALRETLQVLPDGKLLLTGFCPGGSGYCLQRLLPDGRPDVGWGQNGLLSLPDFEGKPIVRNSVTLSRLHRSAEGKLVVYFRDLEPQRLIALHLTPQGAPDPAYGSSAEPGYVAVQGGERYSTPGGVYYQLSYGQKLLPLNSGKLIWVGTGGEQAYRLLRFTSQLRLDASFGKEGAFVPDAAFILGLDVLEQADGQLMLATVEGAPRTQNATVVLQRLSDTGQATLLYRKPLTLPFAPAPYSAFFPVGRLSLQPDGSLLILSSVGYAWDMAGPRPAFLRFTPDGDLDQRFGHQGALWVSGGNSLLGDFLTDAQGRLIVSNTATARTGISLRRFDVSKP